MNNDEFAIIICFIALIVMVVLTIFSIRKEHKRLLKAANSIKPGDLYKWEVKSCLNNPFEKPVALYAAIKEVKFNSSGTPWVKYIADGKVCFDELADFLSHYELVKDEEKKQ